MVPGAISTVLAFVTFIADMAVIMPTRGRLNAIDGIQAKWVSLGALFESGGVVKAERN
jgi:hypothetical protein